LILFRCAKRSILPNKTETSEKAVRSFYGQNSAAQSHKIQRLSIYNPANQLKDLGKKTENIKIPGN